MVRVRPDWVSVRAAVVDLSLSPTRWTASQLNDDEVHPLARHGVFQYVLAQLAVMVPPACVVRVHEVV